MARRLSRLELPVLTLQIDYRQAQPRRGLRLPWISRFLALVRRQEAGLQLVRRYPPELELALQRLLDGPGKAC